MKIDELIALADKLRTALLHAKGYSRNPGNRTLCREILKEAKAQATNIRKEIGIALVNEYPAVED